MPIARPPTPVVLIAGTDMLLGAQSTGGHPSYVRAHALAAIRLGFEPHIFSVAPAGRPPEVTEFGVLHRVRSPVRPLRAHMGQAHSPFLARAVRDFVAGRSGTRGGHGAREGAGARPAPQLIHGFSVWSLAGVLAARALARQGIAATPIASAYTTLAHESRGKLAGLRPRLGRAALEYPVTHAWVSLVGTRLEGYAYRRMSAILVNYESVRELLHGEFGAGLNVQRIPYASALSFEEETQIDGASSDPVSADPAPAPAGSDDAPLIVSVSRHDPRKGVDVLLAALAGLAREGVPFRACLLGPGPLLSANRAYASRLGLDGQVMIPGRVDRVMPHLWRADLFVLPSLEEGSGSVSLLEALQAGCAIVASRLDGIPEDLSDGEDAVLVKPGDARDLQRALAVLLADATARRRLVDRGRALHQARFSPAAFTDALGDVYARLGVRP